MVVSHYVCPNLCLNIVLLITQNLQQYTYKHKKARYVSRLLLDLVANALLYLTRVVAREHKKVGEKELVTSIRACSASRIFEQY